MYGGVSLAVYINGVSQEFFHAVQGNGVYRLIKELTDSDIVLDILSGSSAGGINGILLSYALCNGKDFTRCGDLWRNSADIRRLLRAPTNGLDAVRSVLDSEGYYQNELERAFRLLDDAPAHGEDPSPVRELDLFVTGTDIDGRTYKRVDDGGHVIEVKDHRLVFHLKHREGRKSNLDARSNPAVITALSKLARITSCFPGAMAPVFVSHSNIERKDPSRMSANELLQYWGNLSGATYLLDGGVIDNKPFTHTTHEIFFRTADRKVYRKLFYVEPDPEHFVANDGDIMPEAPSFLKPIVNSLVTIPGYESISDDLKLLSERNEDIREYRRVLQDVLNDARTSYSQTAASKPGVGIPNLIPEPQKSIYRRVRYASISNPALEGIFKNATFENSPKLSEQRTSLIREFDRQISADDDLLRDFDIKFRLRRVFHLIYFVYDLLYGTSNIGASEKRPVYQQLLKRLNSQLELYNVLDSAMERIVGEADYGWNDKETSAPEVVWRKVYFSLRQLLRANELSDHLLDLQELNHLLQDRIERYRQLFVGVTDFRSVLIDADDRQDAFMEEILDKDDPVFRRYLEFNFIDAYLFPLEWVSGVHEKDVIEVFRISPVDAQKGFSRLESSKKTAGDTLGHFSAFFKRTWRSNDILWGRLDGVCELVETLLLKPVIAEAMNNDVSRERARATLLPADGSPSPVNEWFKHSSEAAVRRIKEWIAGLTDPDPEVRQSAISSFHPEDASTGSLQELLIEMAQFEILHECLPNLFEDSIKEQAEWKQVRRRNAKDPEKLEWLSTDISLSGPALDAIAVIGGKNLVQELQPVRPEAESPKESDLGRAFAKFGAGSEEIWRGGVPFLVLSEIVLKAALVLRSCILGSFKESTRRKIRANTFYQWGLDLPLRGLYGAATFYRDAPTFQTAILAGGTLLSILALFIGLKWRDAIIQPGGGFSVFWFAVFIVAPLAWLCAGIYHFSRSRSRDHLSDSVRNAFVAICTAAPVISVTLVYFGLTDVVLRWWEGVDVFEGSTEKKLLMVVVYAIVPFALSFLGGYMALRERAGRRLEDLTGALERMTESDLQDVSDRMGEKHRVTADTRLPVIKALTVSAEMNDSIGQLARAIRAVSPGELD